MTTPVEYGMNIGKLIEDYPDFTIMGDAGGYKARTRGAPEGLGATLRDSNLDGLATQMDVVRARLAAQP